MITFRPGVKLQLQGKIVCRLGVLLLGPANVTLLGGEVEELVDRNNQVNWGKMCFFFSTAYQGKKHMHSNVEHVRIYTDPLMHFYSALTGPGPVSSIGTS